MVWLPPHSKLVVSALTAVRSPSLENKRVFTEAGSPDTSTVLKSVTFVDCEIIVQFAPNSVVVEPRVSVPETRFQFVSNVNSVVVVSPVYSPASSPSALSVRLPFSRYPVTSPATFTISTVWWKPLDQLSSKVLPKWFQSASWKLVPLLSISPSPSQSSL